jgi:hypothetical protein
MMNAFIDILAASDAVLVGTFEELVDPDLLPDPEKSCVGFTQERALRSSTEFERFWVLSEPASTGWLRSPLFLPGERYLLFLRQGSSAEQLAAALNVSPGSCFELMEMDSALLLEGKYKGGSFDLRLERDLGFSLRENVPLFLDSIELLCQYVSASPEERKRLELAVEAESNSFSRWLQRQMALYAARTNMR